MFSPTSAFVEVCREAGFTVTGASLHEALRQHRNGLSSALEDEWYADPGMDLYGDERYLVEAWLCWRLYSRTYLRRLATLQDQLGEVRTVLDAGCGCGYSTAMLADLFPGARVIGTQVPGPQAAVAQVVVSRGVSCEIRTDGTVPEGVDLAFASEYFEHFLDPIAHLEDLQRQAATPRIWVLANTFTQRSPGHYDNYFTAGRKVPGVHMARAFNDRLRSWGYERPRTRFWNNRPAVWVRRG